MTTDTIEPVLPAGECVACEATTDRWEHGELTSYHLCPACHAQAVADLRDGGEE